MSGATKPTRLGKKLLDAIYAVDIEAACSLVANGADVHYVPREGGSNVARAGGETLQRAVREPRYRQAE